MAQLALQRRAKHRIKIATQPLEIQRMRDLARNEKHGR
jgi:hypothetical protein